MTEAERKLQWKDPEIQRLLNDLKISIRQRYLHHKVKRKERVRLKANKMVKMSARKKKAPSNRGLKRGNQHGHPLLGGHRVGVISAAAPLKIEVVRQRLSSATRTGTCGH